MTERRWWAGRGGAPVDPATGYGLEHPEALTLSRLEDVPCLVLIGDSGLGKSHAVDAECRRLSSARREVDPHLLPAADDANEALQWLEVALAKARQGRPVHLFLDGLDEFPGDVRRLVVKLTDGLLRAPDALPYLRLRVVCRAAALPLSFRDGLARAYGERDVQQWTLLPLMEAEVPVVARAIDPEVSPETLVWLRSPRLAPLTARPMALRLLLGLARDRHGAAAAVGPFAATVSWLARDPDEARQGASLVDVEKRLDIARAIATLVVLGERNRVSIDGASPGTALTAGDLRAIAAPEQVSEVVRHSQLFHEGEFIHRSVAEWLAAEQIATADVAGAVGYLFGVEPQGRVVPQLRGLAVLLASRRRFFHPIVARDPFTLLEADPVELEDDLREALLESVFAYRDDPDTIGWSEQIGERLAARAPAAIATKLGALIADAGLSPRKRRLAIELAERGHLASLVALLTEVALAKGDVLVRVAAVRGVATLGTLQEKGALRPLVVDDPEDVDDELKGVVLRVLWPGSLTAQELFQALSRPRNPRLFGAYAGFVTGDLPAHLSRANLEAALAWASSSLMPREQWPPHELLSRATALALRHIDEPPVLAALCDLLRARSEAHEAWLADVREALGGVDDARRREDIRRSLLEGLMRGASPTRVLPVHWEAMAVAENGDLPWLLGQVECHAGAPEAGLWLRAALRLYWPIAEQAPDTTDRLFELAERSRDEDVRARLRRELCDAWGLEEDEVRFLRENELRRRRAESDRRSAEMALASEIEGLLARAAAGDMEAFWRAVHAINSEVRAGGQVVGWSYRRLSTSAWWSQSAAEARARFLSSAREYLLTTDPLSEEWFGKGTRYVPAIAGRLALMLLQEVNDKVLDGLPVQVLERWIPALLDPEFIAEEGPRAAADALLQRACLAAPDMFRERVLTLARAQIELGHAVTSLRSAAPVFGRAWWPGLRGLIDLPSLGPGALRAVLNALADIDLRAATCEAEAAVARWWDGDGVARRAVEAASFLLRRDPDGAWNRLADRFHSNPDRGLRAVRDAVSGPRPDVHCPRFHNPGPLAGFYRWARLAGETASGSAPQDELDETQDFPPVEWMLSAARTRFASIATPEAVAALEELRRSFPGDEALAFALADAREQCLLAQWRGWPLVELARLLDGTGVRRS